MTDRDQRSVPVAYKPILIASDERYSQRYRVLHNREATYVGIALERLSEPVETWHRYLTLFDEALRGDHESPASLGTHDHDSWELRLRLAVTEISTSKLTLDAAPAGYYAQALGLIRRMLEAWKLMVFTRARPDQSFRWLEPRSETGIYPPDESKVNSDVLKYARRKDERLHANISLVNEKIRECNKGTHPSELGFVQMETRSDSHRTIGATYIERSLLTAMSLGTLAMALLLDEVKQVVPLSNYWKTEYDAAAVARAKWH